MLKIHLFSCLFCLLFSILVREPLTTHSSREGNVGVALGGGELQFAKMSQGLWNKKEENKSVTAISRRIRCYFHK